MPLKHDAEAIRHHMRGVAAGFDRSDSRKWWPRWLYRSDHVENAAAILSSGRLLSRSSAEHRGLIIKNSGSPQHVGQLSAEHRRYVRLYFRPRTPTQYQNEGIRPRSKIQYDAHMPVPVYLLFSSELLMDVGVMFSRGRLTPDAAVGDSAEFLRETNFTDIYHDRAVGRMGESTSRSRILNARNSEVLVEDELTLDRVKHIVCRSAAERDTLLGLLEPAARDRWAATIVVDKGRRRLFHKQATFVQEVDLSARESYCVFYSDIDHDMRGPFHLRVEWASQGRSHAYSDRNFNGTNDSGTLPNARQCSHVRVRDSDNLERGYSLRGQL